MRTTRRWLGTTVAVAVTAAVLPVTPALAQPVQANQLVIADGVTQPVFGYADAIRERIFVTSDVDTDSNGELDIVAMDIIRPKASDAGLRVPVVMDASPYYSTVCRGNETECKADLDGDGLLDKWPLFYDNYFVPRGYAVVLLDMIGTNNSTGCPVTGGLGDNISAPTAIDWLNGRRKGFDADGNEVVANWHNGKSGMIGKSYDGTLANAAAATGVDGLSTIVPISAISSWYDYSRSNGLVTRANNYSGSLSNTVTNPNRRAYCAPVRTQLGVGADDATGDYSDFWAERDYVPHADKVKASVLLVHGINDDNVRADHFSKWWYALAENNVPRKLWLTGTGHIDPFDFRRAEWVNTLHRWFDFWLQGINNGIMREPMVDLERLPDVWETHANWPIPKSQPTQVWLRPGTNGNPGDISVKPGPGNKKATFTDTPSMSQANAIRHPSDPAANKDNRLVFLSEPLKAPLHISGTPIVRIKASVNGEDTSFAGLLVDYGTRQRFSTSGDGVRTVTTEDCWGESATFGGHHEEACYRQVVKNVASNPQELVTKGIYDGLNLDSLYTSTPLVPGEKNAVDIPLQPEDYVFEAGHQIGVVLLGSYSGYSSRAKQTRAEITVHFDSTRITLPIVGGRQAAVAAGLN
ncbi:Xaa-Pro dipeptidyl-peptidase [Micromonospora fiedleri]|uniref:Xaa-Pro dipeptidyl-peptidase n=1 Tax=Micromonospora fiedleri TaxID=1157498 RepID=A0ABS1UGF1_9ACTN|nr:MULTISPECIES: Xaa-Pro dipeptidyl-peptidase [Micromonospora]MBL6275397.1 Xaa-Pro dipeptidyl-peptidase [Micromonospora fiedleri]WSK41521.1 Xaa-Pro dipeptidyl-peptidase [Micromonospora maris]